MTVERKDRTLHRLARAVSDASPVNWEVESHANPTLAAKLKELRLLESVAEAHRALGEAQLHTASAVERFLFQWGPLQVIERIGAGSFGDVYRAFDPRLQRHVALKLRNSRASNGSRARHFLDEARRLALVQHPNVVTVHGADIHQGRVGLWTDLVRGRTLEERLTEEGPLSAREASLIGIDLCRALAAVHAVGLIHGDLKASNVMREQGGRILLMDFGAAANPEDSSTRIAFGTPLVAAPEVLLKGARESRPASDLYALGVLLYRLVTGRHPIEATSVEELIAKHRRGERSLLRDRRPDLPADFVQVIEQALAPDPDARHASAGAMERALLGSMDLLEQAGKVQTLRSLLDELGRVPEELCRHIGRDVARALASLHRAGRIHGNLKPQSILITGNEAIELMEPGSDRFSSSSLRCSAPELKHREKQADARADLHSLGVILFELSTGHHPFAGGDPQSVSSRIEQGIPPRVGVLNSQLSPFFQELIRTLLEKDPPRRLGSAAELAEALAEGERSAWWRRRTQEIRRAARHPLRRTRMVRETALYGRDAELERLSDLYRRAKAGEGGVVLVTGEAGIGKTRLVEEFVQSLEQEGAPSFLYGFYPPGGAATETGAFTTAYGEHLGIEGLEATLGDYLHGAPGLIPAFAALLRGDAAPVGVPPLTKETLQTGFVHVTRALAAERPTVVCIDDLHFASEEGRALFAALALAVPGHRVLLVGSARSGLPEDWVASLERYDHVSRLHLSRLASVDVRRLLIDAFASEPVAEELASEIETRSDGNPFFLFEFIHELRERGLVVAAADGRWVLAQPVRDIAIPRSVLHLIQARVSHLEEEDKDLLDVAACCGFEFDPTLVGETLGLTSIDALKRFGRIERRYGLIRESGSRYIFDHHQVQEVLYASLFAQLREHYHAGLASRIEARDQAVDRNPAELDGGVAVKLCDHWLKGGRGDRALRYLEAALDHLEATYANAAAVGLADRVLAIQGLIPGARRIEVLLRKAKRLDLLGRRDEQRASLAEALVLSRSADDMKMTARILTELGGLFFRVAQYTEATAHLTEALELARATEDVHTEASATGALGLIHYYLNRYEEAQDLLARQLSLARQAGSREAEARATGNLGLILSEFGDYEAAQKHFERQLELARETGNRRSEVHAIGNLGNIADSLGEYERARAHFEQELALSHEIGYRIGEAFGIGGLGNMLDSLGCLAEARVQKERCLALFREIGNRDGEARAARNLARLYASLGDLERAGEMLATARSICMELGAPAMTGGMLCDLSAIAEQTGDHATAEHFGREALALQRAAAQSKEMVETLYHLGSLLAATGREEEARGLLAEALDLAGKLRAYNVIPPAAVRLALLTGGKPNAALEAFRDLEVRLSHRVRMEVRFLLWKATGDRSHLDCAYELLQELRDRAPVECRETMIEQVPLHREIEASATAA